MKRMILLFCLCLCVMLPKSLVAQEGVQPEHYGSNDGVYVFSQATLVTLNYGTKQEVENLTITDPALIDSTNFHFQNVFLQITLNNGVITDCILPNKKEYSVRDNTLLEYNKNEPLPDNTNDYDTGQILPLSPYNLTAENGKAIIEFLYPFGDSRYNFSLEAKLTITLTKQEIL